jgi:hypothetical protein
MTRQYLGVAVVLMFVTIFVGWVKQCTPCTCEKETTRKVKKCSVTKTPN